MSRRAQYLLGVAIVAAMAVALVIVIESDGMSLGEGRDAIEGLPYREKIGDTEDGAIVGVAYGPHGAAVHFALAESHDSSGVPNRMRRIHAKTTSFKGVWFFEATETPTPGESKARSRERETVAGQLEEALCQKAYDRPCGI